MKPSRRSRPAVKLVPNSVNGYGNLVGSYLVLDRVDDAMRAFQESQKQNLDGSYLRLVRYVLAFAQQDTAAMNESTTWAAGKPGIEDTFLSAQADTEAFHGRLSKARSLATRAVDSAKRAGAPETAAFWAISQAIRDIELGDAAAARQSVANARALSNGRDVELLSSLVYARLGDASASQKISDRINHDSPVDTLIQGFWLPSSGVVGVVARQRATRRRDTGSESALRSRPASSIPTQYRLPGVPSRLGLPEGRQSGASDSAIPKNSRSSRRRTELHYLSPRPVGIARAYAASGDTTKARAAYSTFLNLWKDADLNSSAPPTSQIRIRKTPITRSKKRNQLDPVGSRTLLVLKGASFRSSPRPFRNGFGISSTFKLSTVIPFI